MKKTGNPTERAKGLSRRFTEKHIPGTLRQEEAMRVEATKRFNVSTIGLEIIKAP